MHRGSPIALLAVAFGTVAVGVSDPGEADAPETRYSATSALTVAQPLARIERAIAPPARGHAEVTIGRSADGRPIRAYARGGLDPDGPVVLAIGCIHGDECAGIEAIRRGFGCPPPGGGIVIVPNLNPDGSASGTRLNANGVDLNRNFAAGWRPIGAAGDPEHSGKAPFSEPETRIARGLIRTLRPDVTIWFHQQEARLVRAWGPSIPAARAYAELAHEPFARMRWLDGTAPNWQNHRFPGTSSFVVELPLEGDARPGNHNWAVFHIARVLTEESANSADVTRADE